MKCGVLLRALSPAPASPANRLQAAPRRQSSTAFPEICRFLRPEPPRLQGLRTRSKLSWPGDSENGGECSSEILAPHGKWPVPDHAASATYPLCEGQREHCFVLEILRHTNLCLLQDPFRLTKAGAEGKKPSELLYSTVEPAPHCPKWLAPGLNQSVRRPGATCPGSWSGRLRTAQCCHVSLWQCA